MTHGVATSMLDPDQVTAEGVAGLSAADLAELVGAFNDVTARLEQTHTSLRSEVARLSDELRETKGQLARARELAALGEMAAGIAHEVRNPLGSIRLYAEALVQDLGDRPAEQGVAGKIVRSVGRLNEIVGDVLAFSRELKLRPEAVDAAALASDVIESCLGRAGERGVSLRLGACAPEATLEADPGLLRQALANVVSNAIDAAAEQRGDAGEVELSVLERSVRLAEGARAPAVGFVVTDNGPGIPADVRGRLFNPFFTTRESGTGLGLAIVHRIVDAHSGAVVIHERGEEPVEAAGACVELKLPRAVTPRPGRAADGSVEEGAGASQGAAGSDEIVESKAPRQTRSVGE